VRPVRVRFGRRRFLKGGLSLVGLDGLSGCGLPGFAGQQSARVPRIGFLATGTREGRAFLVAAFLDGMREHDYTEGRDVKLEYRFSEDRDDRLPELAAELVALKVDVVVNSGVPASFAARDAITTVPVILAGVAADPVETGLIASLARPGGNITGMSQMSSQVSGKRLELFKALPTMMEYRVFPEAGGLLSLGADIADLYRRSAGHVGKVLKRANPAELPVEQASKFDLIVNLKAAEAIGLSVPASVLQEATEVMQ